jgi:two-component system CheB/CheR fusion protein
MSALESLLEGFDTACEAAIIIVQHQDPSFKSTLASILAKHSKLPVQQATDGLLLQSGTVYVVPPGQAPNISHGVLSLSTPLSPLERTGLIDELFASVAQDAQEISVGVILSGSGGDGVRGTRAIKAVGGLTVAQSPSSAEYAEMPQQVIDTGIVDAVLSTAEMPLRISSYLQSCSSEARAQFESAFVPDFLDKVLSALRRELGFDLRGYKRNTLLRRISRRAALTQLRNGSEYLQFLLSNPLELRSLFRDLMINVTNFFRDPQAFEVLAKEAIPAIIARKVPGEAIRVWVPACASGEEAYSIAMSVMEYLDTIGRSYPIQIFATDIDQEALQLARTGRFPESIATEVSPARLQKFFVPCPGGYEVRKELRENIIFAMQNLVGDPPFSRLDLISCRNLFIYLEPVLQRRALSLFHFGLNEGGFLLIGNSETVGDNLSQFEPISKKWRLYRRVGPRRPRDSGRLLFGDSGELLRTVASPVLGARGRNRFAQILDSALLKIFTPAATLINREGDVLYLHGNVGAFLQVKSGDPTTNLLGLLPVTLRTKLRAALDEGGAPESGFLFDSTFESSSGTCRLTVRPAPNKDASEGLFIVSFEALSTQASHPQHSLQDRSSQRDAIEHLENLLSTTREELHSTIEDLEGTNEELRASNEEVVSMNEELQSANEELETSKEELQSVNEELSTVNAQLNSKVSELETLSNDLSNLLSSTEIATIFLDSALNIKRFTPSARKLMNLIAADVGRSISDITKRYDDGNLFKDAETVLSTLAPIEREIRSTDGHWYLQRVLPYRTSQNHIEGVVVTFSDISALKEAADRVVASEARYRHMADTAPVMVWESGLDMGIIFVNRPALEFTGQSLSQACGNGWTATIHPDDVEEVIAGYQSAFHQREPFTSEYRMRSKSGAYRWVISKGVPRFDHTGTFEGYIGTRVDITERRELESELRGSNERYQQLLETTSVIPWEAYPDTLVFTYIGPQAAKLVDIPIEHWMRPNFFESYLHPEDIGLTIGKLRAAGISGSSADFEFRLISGEETKCWLRCIAGPIKGHAERTLLGGFFLDITARKEAERRRDKLERELVHTQKLEALGLLAGGIAHDFNNLLTGMLGYAELGLRETAAEPRVSGRFRGIMEAGGRARDLVQQILAFSRRQEFKSLPVDLTKVIEETIPLLRASMPAIIEIRSTIEAPRLFAAGDSSRFQQVLMNLATNAYQAIGEQAGAIGIALRAVVVNQANQHEHGGVAPGEYVELTVSDTGCGMDQKTLQRIFEPFFTTKAADKGTGMGLAVVHGIISSLGGTILADSTMGAGSIFRVLLPRLSEQSLGARIQSIQPATSGSGHILFVDDEEMIVNLAKEMLESIGYVVSGVTSPSKAYEMFRLAPKDFDLILLDQNMPEMTGVELATKIRALRADIPIIMATGYARDVALERAKEAGIDTIISKPYSLATLSADISKVLVLSDTARKQQIL